jgi:IS5 family transposase
MSQRSFASAEYAMKKKRTRREKFLAEMERIVPWGRLIAVIEPLYPRSGRVGRQPIGVPKMLRMYCLQQWYGLADEALEDALYDSQALRDFVGIDLSRESVPDATTLLKFRRLLQDNDLTRALFDEINAHLSEQGLLMRAGTIVDATIIAAPSSTKNEDKARDPEMHQTKKGKQWCVSRTQAADLWCCTEDGSRPPEAGLQGQASNHPVLLRSKGAVVSDWGKVIP